MDSEVGGPVAQADVIVHDASGAALKSYKTDPSGNVTVDIPEGGAVTLIASSTRTTYMSPPKGVPIRMPYYANSGSYPSYPTEYLEYTNAPANAHRIQRFICGYPISAEENGPALGGPTSASYYWGSVQSARPCVFAVIAWGPTNSIVGYGVSPVITNATPLPVAVIQPISGAALDSNVTVASGEAFGSVTAIKGDQTPFGLTFPMAFTAPGTGYLTVPNLPGVTYRLEMGVLKDAHHYLGRFDIAGAPHSFHWGTTPTPLDAEGTQNSPRGDFTYGGASATDADAHVLLFDAAGGGNVEIYFPPSAGKTVHVPTMPAGFAGFDVPEQLSQDATWMALDFDAANDYGGFVGIGSTGQTYSPQPINGSYTFTRTF